jgi:hypothetical protein
MANLIRQQKLIDTNKRALVKYVVVGDGTQEANTVLLDAGSLAFSLNANNQILGSGTDRKSNYRTTIKRINGQMRSNAALVRVKWNGDTNSEIIVFGSGRFDYDFQSMGDVAVITNPEANTTGNVLISTTGLGANEGFTLFIDIRKDGRDYDSGQTADPVAFNRGPAAP